MTGFDMATFFGVSLASSRFPASSVIRPAAAPVLSKVMVAMVPLPLPPSGFVSIDPIRMGFEVLFIAAILPLARFPITTRGFDKVAAS